MIPFHKKRNDMKHVKLLLIALAFITVNAFGQTQKNNFEISKSLDI